jgi:1-acyl-sn-glycerol-3-phosphate acyltransferase
VSIRVPHLFAGHRQCRIAGSYLPTNKQQPATLLDFRFQISDFPLYASPVAIPSFTTPENVPIRRILHACNRTFARIYHRLDVLTPCRLPPTGPAILVSNHTSPMDPVFIQSVCPRPIVWMMAKEYYDLPVMNWIYRKVEAIPVARSGRDLAATREAMRALKNGRILGLFPEGKIELTRDILPFQTGIALIAAKANAEIFPIFLDGTQRGKGMVQAVLCPQHARIAFGPGLGKHIDARSREALDSATINAQLAVQKLSDAAAKLA